MFTSFRFLKSPHLNQQVNRQYFNSDQKTNYTIDNPHLLFYFERNEYISYACQITDDIIYTAVLRLSMVNLITLCIKRPSSETF